MNIVAKIKYRHQSVSLQCIDTVELVEPIVLC
jgi:hypothetical protein